MGRIYIHRNWIAGLPSVALTVFLAFGVKSVQPLKPAYDEGVTLEIVDVDDIPPPPPPPPPPAPPPPPVLPQVAAPPNAPLPRVEAPLPEPSKQDASPATVAEPAPMPPPPSPPVQVAAPPAPEPPPPAPPKPNVDGEYIGKVRGYLNSIKRYPTGREASLQRPSGTVKVWFTARRDGSIVDSGIEDTANSLLLDNAALATVKRAVLPAFPEAFRPGQETHRFTVELQFVPAN